MRSNAESHSRLSQPNMKLASSDAFFQIRAEPEFQAEKALLWPEP